jgi:hypothetical protein
VTEDWLDERHRQRYRWMDDVMQDRSLSFAARLLGVRLALTTNLKTGACFPAVETLAAQLSMTPRGIRGARSQLEQGGWIRCDFGGHGPRDSNNYTLLRRNNDAASAQQGSIKRRNDGAARGNVDAAKEEWKAERNRQKGGMAVQTNTENTQNSETNIDINSGAVAGATAARDGRKNGPAKRSQQELREEQESLNKLAERLGWDVVAYLSEAEEEFGQLVANWRRGELADQALAKIRADVQAHLLEEAGSKQAARGR